MPGFTGELERENGLVVYHIEQIRNWFTLLKVCSKDLLKDLSLLRSRTWCFWIALWLIQDERSLLCTIVYLPLRPFPSYTHPHRLDSPHEI